MLLSTGRFFGQVGGAPASANLVSLWTGALTDEGISATVVIDNDTTVRLAVSTSSDLSSPTYSSLVASTNLAAKCSISGLTADTTYYYGAEIGGVLDTTTKGQFKTLPSSAAFSFSCAFAGDSQSDTNHAVFDTIRGKAPRFFIHLGDLHYENISTDNDALFRAAYDAFLAQAKPHQLFREVPTAYVWDDHDFGANDSFGTSASKPAAATLYRERVPHYTLEDSDPEGSIYHAFDVGRVMFIVTDQRSAASNKTATDNSSKTMLGATQKTWFKGLLSDAANDGKFFIWICPRVFGGVATASADHWGGFTTERTELADHIQTEAPGRLAVISADMHSLAIDDGSNHDFVTSGSEPLRTFQAAPLDQTGAQTWGGATYSEGQFLNNNLFGTMDIIDAGNGGLLVVWKGWNSGGSKLVEYQFAVDLTGALDIHGVPALTGQDGVAYDGFTVHATGGTAPYTFSVQSGSLPTGLTLDSSTGVISGTPSVDGTFADIVIRVTDDVAATADLAAFTLEIAEAASDIDIWEEIARQETIGSGALTITGLDLSSLLAIQVVISGVTVTDDGTDVMLRFHVSGSEVSTGYQWGTSVISTSTATTAAGSTSDSGIHLSASTSSAWKTGNASTKSKHAIVTVDSPGSTALHKKVFVQSAEIGPTGNAPRTLGSGVLANAGAITGLTVYGSAALTGGKVVVLGLD